MLTAMVLDNPRHEEFAQLVGTGTNQSKAYAKVFQKTGKGVNESACRLRKKVNVQSRIAEIEQGFRQHLDQKTQETVKVRYLTKERSLELLHNIAETPIGEIDEKSGLCQAIEYRTTEGNRNREGYDTIKVKMPDKIRAIELSARLMGYLEDKGTTVNVTTQVNTLTPERQAELQRRKRASIERNRAADAARN